MAVEMNHNPNDDYSADPHVIVAAGKAMLSTPLAAVISKPTVATFDPRGYEINLDYLSPDFKICEVIYRMNTRWADGTLTEVKLHAAPYSSLSAIFCPANLEIRIYYQLDNSRIAEAIWCGSKWHSNLGCCNRGTLPCESPLPGTSLAFVSLDPSSNCIRGYYQSLQGDIKEICQDNGETWFTGGFTTASTDAAFRAPIAATACLVSEDTYGIYVYFVTPSNRIREKKWQPGWSDTLDSGIKTKPLAAGSKIAACSLLYTIDQTIMVCHTRSLNIAHMCVLRKGYENSMHDLNTGGEKLETRMPLSKKA